MSATVSSAISFVPRPCRRRNHAPAAFRVWSVAGMLQRDLARDRFGRWCCDVLVFSREDGEILHCQSEQCEAGGNDGTSDRNLGPLGHVMHAGSRFETSDCLLYTS